MHKGMIFLALCLTAAALLMAFPAHAQESALTISAMAIEVWPEYDQPSALVFFRGQMAEETPLPVELRITLPLTAAVHAVAYADPATGALFDATYEVEGSTVVMTSPSGTFHIEFYDSALQVEGQQRSYTLPWTADYAVDSLFFQVQQPVGVSDFVVEPSGGASAVAEDGLTYYMVEQPAVAMGQTVSLTIRYLKTDSTLTFDVLQAASEAGPAAGSSVPSAPAPTVAAAGVPVWLIAVIVAGVIAGIGIGFVVLRRVSSGAAETYCTHCGKAIQKGDRFCRHCGKKLQ